MEKSLPKSIQDFFSEKSWTKDFSTEVLPAFEHDWQLVNWIQHESGWPYLPIELPGFPWEDVYREALGVMDMFVMHRTTEDDQHEWSHRGWGSLCIHGEAWNKTGYWESYPENQGKTVNDIKFDWCPEVTERCPETTRYFKETFPESPGQRTRFMLLEPGGYIQPHQDRTQHYLGPINIAINNPKGCEFRMKDNGYVPFTDNSACLVDIGNIHSVWNNSDTPRIHIISHGGARPPFNEVVINSIKKLIGDN